MEKEEEFEFEIGDMVTARGDEEMNKVLWLMQNRDIILHDFECNAKFVYKYASDHFRQFYYGTQIYIVKNAVNGDLYIVLHCDKDSVFKFPINKNDIVIFLKEVSDGKILLCFDKPTWNVTIMRFTEVQHFWNVFKTSFLENFYQHNAGNGSGSQNADPRPVKCIFTMHQRPLKFPKRILQLSFITILDLSDNEIQNLPEEIGSVLSLRELNLANNELGNNSYGTDWTWLMAPKIVKTLRVLNLNRNYLTKLPDSMWKLTNLLELHLEYNLIEKLPRLFSKSLECLTIGHNRLLHLPECLLRCPLKLLDVTNNFRLYNLRFRNRQKKTQIPIDQCNVPSLEYLAARVVITYKVDYSILPRSHYLYSSCTCVCGAAALDESLYCVEDFFIQNFFPIVAHSDRRQGDLAVECTMCSLECRGRLVV